MRPAAAAASLVLAGVWACAGYSNGPYYPSDSGVPIGDAGDAGDAGSDAGCAPRSLNTTGFTDSCTVSTGLAGTGSVSVNTAACTVSINTGTGITCSGTVKGANDAFDGGCSSTSGPCSSSALPGTIVCHTGAISSCTIVVCDGGC